MRVLKMHLLGAPAGGDLVEHHLGDLHFCAANPSDAAAIKFNLCGEDGSHWFSPGTSIVRIQPQLPDHSRPPFGFRLPFAASFFARSIASSKCTSTGCGLASSNARKLSYSACALASAVSRETLPAWVSSSRSLKRRKSSSLAIHSPIDIGLRLRAWSSANSR